MACDNCESSTPQSYQPTNDKTNCGSNASDILYTGSALACLDVASNTKLDVILSKINAAVCTSPATIPWNTFDYGCIADSSDITSVQIFAETLSSYICTFRDLYNTFTTATITADIATINNSINALNNLNLTSCAAVGVGGTDHLSVVITKILTNLCAMNVAVDISTANWSSCYTVSPAPTSIVNGFNTLIAQICALKTQVSGSITSLPTFNNIGSCLGGTLTGTDTLYDTVTKIRTKLCTLPTYDPTTITWASCIASPGSSSTLQDALNLIISRANSAYTLRVNTFDPTYFTVTQTSTGNACSGYNITLANPSGLTDRLVALNGGDSSPNYLLSKMTAGANIVFDTTTTPGTVIIKATTSDDHKVLASSSDTVPGTLDSKFQNQPDASGSLSYSQIYNATTKKVDITPTIDFIALMTNAMETIDTNTTLFTMFNNLVCKTTPCPSTTTTTTTASGVAHVIGLIDNQTDSSIKVGVVFGQNSPSVTWYNAPLLGMAPSSSIVTGAYTVTSSANPLIGFITLYNNDTDNHTYAIYVRDASNVAIPGSSTFTGTIIGGGGTFSTAVLNLGHDTTYNLHIVIT